MMGEEDAGRWRVGVAGRSEQGSAFVTFTYRQAWEKGGQGAGREKLRAGSQRRQGRRVQGGGTGEQSGIKEQVA